MRKREKEQPFTSVLPAGTCTRVPGVPGIRLGLAADSPCQLTNVTLTPVSVTSDPVVKGYLRVVVPGCGPGTRYRVAYPHTFRRVTIHLKFV